MLRYLTAGESHGPALLAILEGMPARVPLNPEAIDSELARRQGGYGRGARMRIERDRVEILAGVRHGFTLGSPIGLLVRNRDWANWEDVMGVAPPVDVDARRLAAKRVTRPRPGHGDLAGGLKYGHTDLRNVLERASARETTMRVAVGAVCQALLRAVGVRIASHVIAIGQIRAAVPPLSLDELAARVDESPVYCADPAASEAMVAAIDAAKAEGDTLGGLFEVVAEGVPVGLGSHVFTDRRLDHRLAGALMGIPAIKGVEVGIGFEAAARRGSQVHDPIAYERLDGRRGRFYRLSNRAGGIEAGISNGEPIVLRAAMKPIATLYKPLPSVDIESKERFEASVERSDVCAVPAASVVGRAVVAIALADALLEKFGGDSLDELRRNLDGYREDVSRR